jgi:hypothetical protein
MNLISKLKKILISKRTIYKNEIPSKYIEGLTLLNPNAGNTTLAYGDPNKEYVYIFTRDSIKHEWLTIDWSPNRIGEFVDEFESSSHRLKDLPIYIIKMPYLYPLDNANKKIVKQIIARFKNIYYSASKSSMEINQYTKNITLSIQDYILNKYPDIDIEYAEDIPDKIDAIIFSLYEFFKDYSDFIYDISIRQFMQTKDGELILLDPVASIEVVDYINGR